MSTTAILTTVVLTALLLLPSLCAAADAELGRMVFAIKRCDRCHGTGGEQAAAPGIDVLRRPQGEMELAGRLWNHVPTMFQRLGASETTWPPISTQEMGDLMAFLGADGVRDPAPDHDRGQLMLLRKGCLKCHSLRREGGRVEPDLADRREDYDSPAAWAATMWTHTPRMAAMALKLGIPYPRFSGDEMGHLVGFLRYAAENPSRRLHGDGRPPAPDGGKR